MFTRSDFTKLMDSAPEQGISLYLPTHPRGPETRQDPIRLKNLIAEAKAQIEARGTKPAEAEALLAPATALIENSPFWEHQEEGLAIFLGGGEAQIHHLPIPVAAEAFVGPGFHLTPLLPLLAKDGAFHVLTITADRVRLYEASRFGMAEAQAPGLPQGVDDLPESVDYQAPADASPANRPNTGGQSIAHAQVLGDSPEEFRKQRLESFVHRVAAAFGQHVARHRTPVVVAADATILGLFRKEFGNHGLIAGDIETNPEAMTSKALHAAAYDVIRPRLDGDRRSAAEHFAALHGSDDPLAVVDVGKILAAAQAGQVDTLLLAEGARLRGRFDANTGRVSLSEADAAEGPDLLDMAVEATLRHRGKVFVVAPEDMSGEGPAAAVLRFVATEAG